MNFGWRFFTINLVKTDKFRVSISVSLNANTNSTYLWILFTSWSTFLLWSVTDWVQLVSYSARIFRGVFRIHRWSALETSTVEFGVLVHLLKECSFFWIFGGSTRFNLSWKPVQLNSTSIQGTRIARTRTKESRTSVVCKH